MSGERSRSARSAFAGLTRACTLAVLWIVVACAWCIRTTFQPIGKTAARVEEWALRKIWGDE